MAFKIANLVEEDSATTGTGTYTLLGAIDSGHRTFGNFLSNGDKTLYRASDSTGYEVGIGTWSTGGLLARTTILDSSNGNAAVNWGAGTRSIVCADVANYMGMGLALRDSSDSTKQLQFDLSGIPTATTRTLTISADGSLSGTNTGDQDLSGLFSKTGGALTGPVTLTSTATPQRTTAYDSTHKLTESVDASGNATLTATGNVTITPTGGTTNFSGGSVAPSVIVTSTTATAFVAGQNGTTNPVLQVDCSTAFQADGIKVTGAAAGNGTTIAGLSSGSNSDLFIFPKGTGGLGVGNSAFTVASNQSSGKVVVDARIANTGGDVLSLGTLDGTFRAAFGVNVSASSLYFFGITNHVVRFGAANAERLRLDTSGNVIVYTAGGVLGSGSNSGTPDVGFSRTAAATYALGNGTSSDASGTLKLSTLTASTINTASGNLTVAPAGGTTNVTGAVTATTTSATALAIGPNGTTNPVLQVDCSTSSQADGIKVTGAAAGSGTTITALSSGSDSNVKVVPKGTGQLTITNRFEASDATVYNDNTIMFSVNSNSKADLFNFYDNGAFKLILKRVSGLLQLANTGIIGMGTTYSSPDTSLSRVSAGVWGVGTGAQGSVAGGIQAATIALGTGCTIGTSGSQIKRVLTATASLDFGSIAAGGSGELDVTVTGAVAGDGVRVSPSGSPESGLVWCGYAGTDKVTVRVDNTNLISATDPASRTWRVEVLQY